MRMVLSVVIAAGLLAAPAVQQWEGQRSGTDARLRGISAVSSRVAWASGARGTVLRTVDGGRVWQALTVPGAGALDFRDIDAMSDRVAYVLSIGNGPASRIYKTEDSGAIWTLQFQNEDPKAFFDAMAFWDEQRGIAFSDSVDGRFVILRTLDGGRSWTPIPAASLPPALDNEGAFAASGTNVTMSGRQHVWIATGAAVTSRVLYSSDAGNTWAVANTPLATGSAAGAFSIAFRDTRHGLIVGGDYNKEDDATNNAAMTSDGGRTWKPVTGLTGYRSVVAHLPGGRGGSRPWLAVGPNGADLSLDDGKTWSQISSLGFDTVAVAKPADGEPATIFGAGANGRLGRLQLKR
ncbi:MAG: hypothetical protein M3R55_09650 [Acidobacteriota bacterium]|nr:hypothetical protein [Acidobacteriota bacterium]